MPITGVSGLSPGRYKARDPRKRKAQKRGWDLQQARVAHSAPDAWVWGSCEVLDRYAEQGADKAHCFLLCILPCSGFPVTFIP